MKDLIDRQQLLAEMYMAADGNLHDIFRNIEGGETLYATCSWELAISMIKDMKTVEDHNKALIKARDRMIDLFRGRQRDHESISVADIVKIFADMETAHEENDN